MASPTASIKAIKEKQRWRDKWLSPKTKEVGGEASAALITTSTLLDGVPIPGLKAAVGGVLEILKTVDRLQSNAEQVEQLRVQLENIVNLVIIPIQDANITDSLQARINKLTADLEHINSDLEQMSKRSRVRQLLDSNHNADTINGLHRMLSHALQTFLVGGIIQVERRVEDGYEASIVAVKDKTIQGRVEDVYEASNSIEKRNEDIHDATAAAGNDIQAVLDVVAGSSRVTQGENVIEGPESEQGLQKGQAELGKSITVGSELEYASEQGLRKDLVEEATKINEELEPQQELRQSQAEISKSNANGPRSGQAPAQELQKGQAEISKSITVGTKSEQELQKSQAEIVESNSNHPESVQELQKGHAEMETITEGPEANQETEQKDQAQIRKSIIAGLESQEESLQELQNDQAEIGKSVTKGQNDEKIVERGGEDALQLDSGMEGTKEVAGIIESRTLTTDEEVAPSADLQMATNINSLPWSDAVDQVLTKPECEDCERYKEDCERYRAQLLENQIQIRALSDHNNLLLQERRKGAKGLSRWFSSTTNKKTTASAGNIQSESEIRECKPEYRETVFPSEEDLATSSRSCCVIQ
ncbi:hypothetical protein FRC03_001747 [Tulasnella sp. 419]|nr:hypothetical protein FRC03_001747 [Tulasnella sp. 419]